MGDLDANGNVINNEPAHTARLKSNATDTRRVIPDTPDVFIFPNLVDSSGGTNRYQTISDLTGVDACTEGIEIIIHGATAVGGSYRKFRSRNHIVKISGTTGTVHGPESEGFLIQRGSIDTAGADPNGETSESIFIPSDDPTSVCLGNFENPSLANLDTNPAFRNAVEIRIK